MTPLVSVIITIHNRIEYISEAIKSVLTQRYKNYEIIVVDDGSTIDVKDVLEPYKDKIKYLYQENKGLAAARNYGIRNSRGKYFAFLDDDDLFEPRKLEIQVAILENNPEVGFVYSDGYVFDTTNPSELELNPAVARDRQNNEFVKLFFMNTNVFVSSALVRRKCFEDVGLFDESLRQNEDSDILLRIALKWQVKFSDYPSTRIRHHPYRMSLNRIEIYDSVLKSCQKVLRLYPDFRKDLGADANKKIAELHYLLARAYIKDRKFNEAKKELDAHFSSCKSVIWNARLYKLILRTWHPSIIFNLLSIIRRSAKILLKLKSYLRFC